MSRIGIVEKRLLGAALKGICHAHTLWGFRVGAAVLAEDGETYNGCNIETWISGLGTCAERCAIDHAILHGKKKIKEIAIVTDSDNPCESRPCGACLEYIHTFAANPKIKIVMAKAEKGRIRFETVRVKPLEELLPYPSRKRTGIAKEGS